MASAVTETATWETSVIGPDGADLRSASGVRTGLQDLANRTKWLKESLIVVSNDSVSAGTCTNATGFVGNTTGALVAITTAVGDVVQVQVTGTVTFNSAEDIPYQMKAIRTLGGTTVISEVTMDKSAAWTAGERIPFSLNGAFTATTAGAETVGVYSDLDTSFAVACTFDIFLAVTHYKMGT